MLVQGLVHGGVSDPALFKIGTLFPRFSGVVQAGSLAPDSGSSP